MPAFSSGRKDEGSRANARSLSSAGSETSQSQGLDSTQSWSRLPDMPGLSPKSAYASRVIPPSSTPAPDPLGPIETGKEAKEKDPLRKSGSWIKNIGTGMRTLRLRKGDKDKADKRPSILEPEAEPPAGGPLPPTPDKQAQALPPTPDKAHHVTKGKKGRSGGSANGSLPRDKSKPNPEPTDKADPARFIGEGLTFKAKLIGILEVSGPRGDRICQEALSELKMAVKAAGEHKQKVTVHVALDGLRLRDEKTGDCLYHHQVHKISFIAQDLTDTRAFGYIFGSPDTGHRFFGIKTEKSASQVVMAMRDLFQVVFDLKKKEIERAKQQLEMQQKFLATRAAETAPRTSHKSGIAETYIEGACALGGPPSPRTSSAPAEADLLNLEVELTNLQEGLDNIHSTLIDTAHASTPFNRGSTASISSDPLNPMPPAFKYSSGTSSAGVNNSSFSAGGHNNSSFTALPNPPRLSNATPTLTDPFGDSFDPFERNGPALTSPSFPADPFTGVDPFPSSKFESSTEFLTSDPFETPLGGVAFTFPDSFAGKLNSSSSSSAGIRRQTSISSVSSDKMLGRSREFGPIKIAGPGAGSAEKRLETGNSKPLASSWTASFEDNFVPESTLQLSNGNGVPAGSGSSDIFTDLDPLGIGRVRPFVDRKDFFHDLKNPPRKVLSELSTPPVPEPTTAQALTVKDDPAALPNSFSTNFAPPPPKSELHLRTSSIRVQPATASIGGDSPPSYSPPPPPPTSSAVSNSVYFVNPPTAIPTPPSSRFAAKKSPQLLRNMTISSSQISSSPTTLPRSSFRHTQTLEDEMIPNLTPPPRPPHTTGGSATLTRLSSAVPRPHSGGEGRRQQQQPQQQQGHQQQHQQQPIAQSQPQAPEPPPRPLMTTTISSTSASALVSPPPLPPKKQATPTFSTLTKVLYTERSGKAHSSAEGSSNDLPLPLPLRKTGGYVAARYAYPPEAPPTATMSTSDLTGYPKLSMEAALNQVAALSLGQLAQRLKQPVEKLTSCTIQELAMKLTLLDLGQKAEDPEDDFSTVSAPAAPAHTTRSNAHVHKQSYFDKYAVFRELTVEDASGFSVTSPPTVEGSEDEAADADPGTKTLTSRESSSEKTLQADFEPSQSLSTLDDVTDVNFSDGDGEDRSALFDEVVDLNSKAEWATFESNFEDQFVPLALAFNNKEEDSPWDSDGAEQPVITELKSAHVPKEESVYEFVPLDKPSLSMDPSGRRSSRDRQEPKFVRQSSGSSKHSDRSERGQRLATTSDYSDSGRERPLPRRRSSREEPRPRADSRNSYTSTAGRKLSYSRDGDSDEYSVRRRRDRDRYYDGEPEHGTRSHRGTEDDDDDDRSYHSKYSSSTARRSGAHASYSRRQTPSKHYSSSGGRRKGAKGRDGEYSNHESDCDDSVEEEGRRRDRDRYRDRSSRPPSSGSGNRDKRHTTAYRDSPRDHRRDRDHHHYYRDRHHRHRDEDYEYDGREASDGSGTESTRFKRIRGRRAARPEPDRSTAYQYNTNSPSWDSESPPPPGDRDRDRDLNRGDGYRRSDRDRDYRPRYGSSGDHGRRGSRYQSEQSLNSKSKLSASEFGPESQRSDPVNTNGNGRSPSKLTLDPPDESGSGRKGSTERPPQSPFEDDFQPPENGTSAFDPENQADPFFLTKFDFEPKAGLDMLEAPKVSSKASSPKELGSVIEEKSEPSSPEVTERSTESSLPPTPIIRKPIMKDTIPEVPDPDMKKSDSFNIFERAKDPFADDDFFV